MEIYFPVILYTLKNVMNDKLFTSLYAYCQRGTSKSGMNIHLKFVYLWRMIKTLGRMVLGRQYAFGEYRKIPLTQTGYGSR